MPNQIIHDPTRGWLLLTEKWPEYPKLDPYSAAICLSTAVDISREDWGEVRLLAYLKIDPPNLDWVQDHHPYSVDAEFEVKEQFRRTKKGLEGLDDSSGYFVWLNCNDSNRDTAGGRFEYRQIARLVKAKEETEQEKLADISWSPQPEESQDELWEQIAQSIITHVQVMPELKARFRIERI